jgi:hypothetical protein
MITELSRYLSLKDELFPSSLIVDGGITYSISLGRYIRINMYPAITQDRESKQVDFSLLRFRKQKLFRM